GEESSTAQTKARKYMKAGSLTIRPDSEAGVARPYGLAILENDRLSKPASEVPAPANRTAAIAALLTQMDCVCCVALAVALATMLPSLPSASRNGRASTPP